MSQPSPVPDRPAPESEPPSVSEELPQTAPTPPGGEAPVPAAPMTPSARSEIPSTAHSATPPGDLGLPEPGDGDPPTGISAPRHLGTPVPFAAPPRDRDGTRLAVTIIVSALAVVLLCGGGLVGFTVTSIAAGEAMLDRSTEAADTFMGDIVEGRYQDAYDSLCSSAVDDGVLTPAAFESEWDALGISRYEVRQPFDKMDGSIGVPVEASSTDGGQWVIALTVVLDSTTMGMSVCAWDVS